MWSLLQAEVAIYVVAQTMPLLRVLFLGSPSKDNKSPGSATGRLSLRKVDRSKTRADGLDLIQEVRASVELAQLPSGKTVSAESKEGKAFK